MYSKSCQQVHNEYHQYTTTCTCTCCTIHVHVLAVVKQIYFGWEWVRIILTTGNKLLYTCVRVVYHVHLASSL